MGARYYNPTIGRFLTPDTVLPSPTDSLSYDRYAYTRNNPINLIDPTGNFAILPAAIIIGALIGGTMAAISGQNILLGMWLGAASGAFFGAAAGSFWGSVAAGFATGAMNSMVYGGNILRGAIVGAITAGIGYEIGQVGGAMFQGVGKVGQGVVSAISGGVVGGLASVAMGGSFSEGFKTGFISAGLSYAANEIAGEIIIYQKSNSSFTGKKFTVTETEGSLSDVPQAVIKEANDLYQKSESDVIWKDSYRFNVEYSGATAETTKGDFISTNPSRGKTQFGSGLIGEADLTLTGARLHYAVPDATTFRAVWVMHTHLGGIGPPTNPTDYLATKKMIETFYGKGTVNLSLVRTVTVTLKFLYVATVNYENYTVNLVRIPNWR